MGRESVKAGQAGQACGALGDPAEASRVQEACGACRAGLGQTFAGVSPLRPYPALRSSVYLAYLPLWGRWLGVCLVKSRPWERPCTESFEGRAGPVSLSVPRA